MNSKFIDPDDLLKNSLRDTSVDFAGDVLIEAAESVARMLDEAEHITRSLTNPDARTEFVRRKPLVSGIRCF